ncbi:MAG: diaminobutyrate--2-oxoglutarate transaminase [Myxococcales bacterium]|nr:diaminobutyrate--2-oxoglutarate transaminase [Myxococcales bacterium]
MNHDIFDRRESEVRSYCRTFPVVFRRAEGCRVFDEQGRAYIDFFAGAGALNLGHNHPRLRRALIDYLMGDNITHSLDFWTTAKRDFMERFEAVLLAPRGLDYKLQFTGPTGTNAVEAALKLARKVTGRPGAYAFHGSFHGVTLGSLAVTGAAHPRKAAGVDLRDARLFRFDDSGLDALEQATASAQALPAAVIVETTQCEGGVLSAESTWLQRLESICRTRRILLIADEIQTGCGRTGPFFSFERAGLTPDMVCLSKSLSGYGLPLAVTLIRPHLDQWQTAEHNGTFRGFNLAFVTASEALSFWETPHLQHEIAARAKLVESRLLRMCRSLSRVSVRGLGLLWGIECPTASLAVEVQSDCFEAGLLVERCGPRGEVIKVMPPLTIDRDSLELGLQIMRASLVARSRHASDRARRSLHEGGRCR